MTHLHIHSSPRRDPVAKAKPAPSERLRLGGITNLNSVPKMAADQLHQPIQNLLNFSEQFASMIFATYMCSKSQALHLEGGVQEKGCVWNVRASCLGQETLWHVKGISQTWVHRMINSAANLSTNCIHTIILKDYWTIHLGLFCELSMKLNSLAADTSSSFFWGIFWMVLLNQALSKGESESVCLAAVRSFDRILAR